ncbi:DegT/DnrJ/EryC1/StrS family aminotransferase, partial [Pseudomonas aeruginosa]
MTPSWAFSFAGTGPVSLEGMFRKVYGNTGEFVRSLTADSRRSACGTARGRATRGFDLHQALWVRALHRVACSGFSPFTRLSIHSSGPYMNNKTIPVTSPLLPPLEEFIPYLEKIWESRFLTNGGDMHHALEEALCEYLGVKHIVLFANATLALITALQALRVTGEVITTPYSFVATSHA